MIQMTEFNFIVEYHGKAQVSVKAGSIKEARDKLNDSCLLEEHAAVENNLEFEFDEVKKI